MYRQKKGKEKKISPTLYTNHTKSFKSLFNVCVSALKGDWGGGYNARGNLCSLQISIPLFICELANNQTNAV